MENGMGICQWSTEPGNGIIKAVVSQCDDLSKVRIDPSALGANIIRGKS